MGVKSRPIILIEPDEAVRTAISSLLRQHGWEIEARAEAGDLRGLLQNEPPLALISESALPDISAKKLLEFGHQRAIPVIFLGHKREIQYAIDLIHLGAKDFMEKPFPQDRLLNMLNSLAASNPS